MAQTYYDDPYAVVANPDIYGGGNPHMRANPGYLLERDELPAEQHAPHIVVGGTLIAGLLGAAVVALVEYGPRALPEAMRSYWVRTAMRALGVVAGVGIAFRYPVIGSAVAGASAWKLAEGVLDNFAWGPMTLAPGAGEAPAAGLEPGGVWQPYPTGAHRVAA
jgi:hypothetical protein